MPITTEAALKQEIAFARFMDIITEAANGKDKAALEFKFREEDDAPLIALHEKMLTEDRKYAEIFKEYSLVMQSPAHEKMTEKFNAASKVNEDGHFFKAFGMAFCTAFRHLPTLIDLQACEKNIKPIFKQNFEM